MSFENHESHRRPGPSWRNSEASGGRFSTTADCGEAGGFPRTPLRISLARQAVIARSRPGPIHLDSVAPIL